MLHPADTKNDEIHLEHRVPEGDIGLDDHPSKDPKDDFDEVNNAIADGELSFWRTLRVYWKPMLICFGTGICAMGDGYQFKMPGNIVALRGFINQMGAPGPTGVYILNPQHVAAWGGESDLVRRRSR